jgi:hypothetical protein
MAVLGQCVRGARRVRANEDLDLLDLHSGDLLERAVEHRDVIGCGVGAGVGVVGSARGAWAARLVLARLAWFPLAATSIRACGSPAHGSPTFFTAGFQRPWRHGQ